MLIPKKSSGNVLKFIICQVTGKMQKINQTNKQAKNKTFYKVYKHFPAIRNNQ